MSERNKKPSKDQISFLDSNGIPTQFENRRFTIKDLNVSEIQSSDEEIFDITKGIAFNNGVPESIPISMVTRPKDWEKNPIPLKKAKRTFEKNTAGVGRGDKFLQLREFIRSK